MQSFISLPNISKYYLSLDINVSLQLNRKFSNFRSVIVSNNKIISMLNTHIFSDLMADIDVTRILVRAMKLFFFSFSQLHIFIFFSLFCILKFLWWPFFYLAAILFFVGHFVFHFLAVCGQDLLSCKILGF